MDQVIKYIKSDADAKLNLVCGLIVVTSMITYKAYEFKCPCVPGYNKPYAFIVFFTPPMIFFLVGITVSQYCDSLTIECSRPEGNREKNKKVLRHMFIAMTIRALAAPVLWILVCLLDGKPFVCAFSEMLDPEQFGGFADYTKYDTALLLAKVPCKTFELLSKSSTRKAISRFLKFLSQGIGCVTVLTFIVIGSIAKIVTNCYNTSALLQLRYWSRYSDMEEKYFEVMCIEHNHTLAERSVKSYFESRRRNSDNEVFGDRRGMINTAEETLTYVDKWYNCRPTIFGADFPDHQC